MIIIDPFVEILWKQFPYQQWEAIAHQGMRGCLSGISLSFIPTAVRPERPQWVRSEPPGSQLSALVIVVRPGQEAASTPTIRPGVDHLAGRGAQLRGEHEPGFLEAP